MIWWRIMAKEICAGLALNKSRRSRTDAGFFLWPSRWSASGERYALVALTVGCSLIGVVLSGALSGSMLPLILHRLGLNPASASAPFVATLRCRRNRTNNFTFL